jgi:hypothetical protein
LLLSFAENGGILTKLKDVVFGQRAKVSNVSDWLKIWEAIDASGVESSKVVGDDVFLKDMSCAHPR